MEGVIEKLEGLKLQHPANSIIKEILSYLQGDSSPSWSVLQDKFQALEHDGIWVSTAENTATLEALKSETDSSANTSSPKVRRNISMIQPPPQMLPHPLLHHLPNDTLIPLELLDSLNQSYFLHLLANDPEKVMPPGKSLLSVLSKPHARERRDRELPTLQDKVEGVIHKAFWDEVCLLSALDISNFETLTGSLLMSYVSYQRRASTHFKKYVVLLCVSAQIVFILPHGHSQHLLCLNRRRDIYTSS